VDKIIKDSSTLAQDPTNANIIYSGGSILGSAGYILAIGKSTNGGVSWPTPWLPLSMPSHCYDLSVAPSNPQIVYAAGYWGASDYSSDTRPLVLRSGNGGQNWTEVSGNLADLVGSDYYGDTGKNAVNCIFVHPTSANSLLVGAPSGAFASRNGGQFWSATDLTFPVVAFVYDAPRATLFAATSGAGVYYSTDDGDTWKPWNEGLENPSCNCMAIDPVNQYLYIGTTGGGSWRAPIVLPNSVNGRSWDLYE